MKTLFSLLTKPLHGFDNLIMDVKGELESSFSLTSLLLNILPFSAILPSSTKMQVFLETKGQKEKQSDRFQDTTPLM